MTAGRRPNTENIGLEAVGVAMDGPFVKVDRQQRTKGTYIYAIGDVAGQPMLAHKATHEGEVVAEVIAGHNVARCQTVQQLCSQTLEIAANSGTRGRSRRARGPIKVGKMFFAAIGRTTNNDTDGFIMIIDAESQHHSGCDHRRTVVCSTSSASGPWPLKWQKPWDVGLTIHPHPTLGEGMMEACKAALGEAVHILN